MKVHTPRERNGDKHNLVKIAITCLCRSLASNPSPKPKSLPSKRNLIQNLTAVAINVAINVKISTHSAHVNVCPQRYKGTKVQKYIPRAALSEGNATPMIKLHTQLTWHAMDCAGATYLDSNISATINHGMGPRPIWERWWERWWAVCSRRAVCRARPTCPACPACPALSPRRTRRSP